MKCEDFHDCFNYLMSKTIKERKPFILCGDFNFNLLNYNNHQGTQQFVDLLLSHCFIPKVLHPTRHTPRSSTLIDNIFMNSEIFSTYSGNINASLSDHLPQFLFLEDIFGTTNNKDNKKKVFIYYSNYDKAKFVNKVKNLDWNKILILSTEHDVDSGFEMLFSDINSLIEGEFPKKSISKNKNLLKKPWMSKALLKSVKTRDHKHKLFLKEKDPSKKNRLFEEYKFYRNKLTELIRNKKKNSYYLEFFEKNNENCKKHGKESIT